MADQRGDAEGARIRRDFSTLTEAIPYAKFMGIKADASTGELLLRMESSAHLTGNASLQALHGGSLGALLEFAAMYELLFQSETHVLPRTITVTVDYLRSAKVGTTFAHGIVTKRGRRVTTVHATAWQEDRTKPVATANAHFLILPSDPSEAEGT